MQAWSTLLNWQGSAVLCVVLGLALIVALALWRVRSRNRAGARTASPLPGAHAAPQAEVPNKKAVSQDVSQGQTVHLTMLDRNFPADPKIAEHTHADARQVPTPGAADEDHDSDQSDAETEPSDPMPLGLKMRDYGSMGREDAVVRCSDLMVMAQRQIEASAAPAAAGSLREVILLAAANGLADQQAAARLELGELARQDGDLITACEHWQIARGLFYDLKNKPRVKAIETRMREHGCPTDWVLNDF